nr:hypothetical protein [Salinicola corii]
MSQYLLRQVQIALRVFHQIGAKRVPEPMRRHSRPTYFRQTIKEVGNLALVHNLSSVPVAVPIHIEKLLVCSYTSAERLRHQATQKRVQPIWNRQYELGVIFSPLRRTHQHTTLQIHVLRLNIKKLIQSNPCKIKGFNDHLPKPGWVKR